MGKKLRTLLGLEPRRNERGLTQDTGEYRMETSQLVGAEKKTSETSGLGQEGLAGEEKNPDASAPGSTVSGLKVHTNGVKGGAAPRPG